MLRALEDGGLRPDTALEALQAVLAYNMGLVSLELAIPSSPMPIELPADIDRLAESIRQASPDHADSIRLAVTAEDATRARPPRPLASAAGPKATSCS